MGQFKKPQTLEFQKEHQCLESNSSVQSQKLLPILKTNIQNLTLKHYCSSWDTRSPNPPPVTIYLFLQSWEGLPSNLQNITILTRVHSTIAHRPKWIWGVRVTMTIIFCSFVLIDFCPFSKALEELCYLVRVKQWHNVWRKASKSLAVVTSSTQTMRLLHLNLLVMW